MAAKKTSDIVPLCHPLLLTKVNISINIENKNIIKVESRVVTCGKTGPDVEAMISASIAAVSIYDMCKQFDRAMSINNVSLEEKTGGKSGKYVRKASKKRS